MFLALVLLAFNTRRMARLAHLALSPIRFTVQLDFTVSDRFSYQKASRLGLDVVTFAEMSPSRLPSDAVCIYYPQNYVYQVSITICQCMV